MSRSPCCSEVDALGMVVQPQLVPEEPGVKLRRPIADRHGGLDRVAEDLLRPLELAGLEQGQPEVGRKLRRGLLVAGGQRMGAGQQADCGLRVTAPKSEPSSLGKSPPGLRGDVERTSRRLLSRRGTGCLLQVIPEELCKLVGSVAGYPFQPRDELPVQIIRASFGSLS